MLLLSSASKILALVIALLVGFQVQDIFYRWSTNTVPLVAYQIRNEISGTAFDMVNRTVHTCFTAFTQQNRQKSYPVAIYEPDTPAFYDSSLLQCVAVLCFVNVFILAMLRYTWNTVVDRRKQITERQGATSEHNSISSHSSNITRLASSLRTLSSLTFISGSGLSASSLGNLMCSIGDFINTGMFNLEVLDILGAGSYATLYKVRDGLNVIAAKISHSSSVSSVLRKEYAIMSRLSHPNIVSVYHEIPRGYLLECLFEDLCTFIARFEPMLPDIRDAISLGITKAVSYLHSLGIAHLDIKPDNVLLTSSTVPKLCDFGLAMEFRKSDGSLEYLHGFYGSFYSVPPEMFLLNSPIDMCKSDSWSLGVTFFIIMTCSFPFRGNSASEVLSNQLNGNFDFPPDMVNIIHNDPAYSLYMDMIRGLCNIDPRGRFSPSDILSFYWHQGPET